jgi:hypothetical protein
MPLLVLIAVLIAIVAELIDPAAGPSFVAGTIWFGLFVVVLPLYLVWLVIRQDVLDRFSRKG